MKRETTIASAEFRAHCLELMEEVAGSEREVTVTRHGRGIARVSRVRRARGSWPFPDLSDWVVEVGDIISPIDVEWEAMAPEGSDAGLGGFAL